MSEYWRSLSEHRALGTELEGEFPPGADEIDEPTRRSFLALIGASLGAGALEGCFRKPPDPIVPYVRQPADVKPGLASHYATAMTLGGFGVGLIVTSREGRPIKVEGNPAHSASLGASGVYEQAAIYQLCDPQRARQFKKQMRPAAWRQFLDETHGRLDELAKDGGARLRFLVEPTSSPLELALRQEILQRFPLARFYAWNPLARDAVYEGTRLSFGRALEPQLDLDAARVIVALDADFLSVGPSRLRHQRRFADHRVPEGELNRLYAAECHLSVTGANADHRLRARSSEIHEIALAILAAISPDRASSASRFSSHPWVKAAAKDLLSARGAGLVIAGDRQPASVHALACAINEAIGSKAVHYTKPALEDTVAGPAALRALADEIRAGAVETLVVSAYNPVYTAPADLDFANLLSKVPHTIYRGHFEDETARHVSWFLPATHELESWGDVRAQDGTTSLIQPLITPLWDGICASELFGAFAGKAGHGSHRLLREHWARRRGDIALVDGQTSREFDVFWETSLQRGLITEEMLPAEPVTLDWSAVVSHAPISSAAAGIELNFLPDSRILDGRFADNAWLQELPDPITKLTWSNALLLSPKTAAALGLSSEDRVSIGLNGRTITAAVLISPGHADDAASIALGYGRSGTEVIARELGANGYLLQKSGTPWFQSGALITKSSGKIPLSLTQEHWSTEGRPVALEVSATDVRKRHLPLVDAQYGAQPTLYPEVEYPGYRWAMSIDMSRCTGCSACVIACESENNGLVVGADQVRRGREMQWLRIDRYFKGDPDSPSVVMQPVACVHCENAPCEYVCPVNATVHSDEGLNEMVYNRCVGTRYCSNNCPYKVRRFNFLNYHDNLQGTEELAMNPEVTVRSRGVMEKCSYCVQRIEGARIRSEIEGRPIADGEVVSACMQSCPSQAIVFGSLHDPDSRVSKLQKDPRAHQLLHELGTRPRTVHLAKIRNPNPELGE